MCGDIQTPAACSRPIPGVGFMSDEELIALVQTSAFIALVTAVIYFGGRSVDKVDPEDRPHRPSRYSEAVSKYLMAASLFSLVCGGAWLLVRWLAQE